MRPKSMNFYAFAPSLLAVAVLFFAVAAGAPALSAPAKARVPHIRDLVVIEKQGQFLVFASLESAFSSDLFDAVHSGVTTRFVYEVALVRARRFLFDTEVVTRQLVHQVKYDALKKAYTFSVRREPEGVTRKVTQSQQEMVDWMTGLNGARIAYVRHLDPDGRYYLRVRAKVNSVDFSFPFNYLLSFLGEKTEWAFSSTFGVKGM